MSRGARPLRVAYYLSTIGYGGMEMGMLQLLRALDRTRYAPLVFLRCTDPEGDRALRDALASLSVPVVDLGKDALPVEPAGSTPPGRARRWVLELTPSSVRWARYTWRRIHQVAAVFRQLSLDVLHVYHGAYPNLEIPVIAGWVAGVACRVSSVQAAPAVAPSNSRLRRALGWWAIQCPTDIVAQSESICRQLADRYGVPGRLLRVIPTGIEPDARASDPGARETMRRALGIAPGACVMSVVARLSTEKGHQVLLEAAAQVQARHPELVYLIVGQGPLRATLEADVRARHLERCVKLLGFRTDVAAILACSDAAVLPSLSEGMPAAVLEAMAAGVPVIATDVGAVGEMLSHEPVGALVPPGEAAALAKTLARVASASPQQRQAWGAAGRRVVRAHYSQRQTLEATLALYAQAWTAAERAGAPANGSGVRVCEQAVATR